MDICSWEGASDGSINQSSVRSESKHWIFKIWFQLTGMNQRFSSGDGKYQRPDEDRSLHVIHLPQMILYFSFIHLKFSHPHCCSFLCVLFHSVTGFVLKTGDILLSTCISGTCLRKYQALRPQFGLSIPFLCVSPQLQLLIYSPASNDTLENAGLWLFPSNLICIRLEFLLPKSTRAAATATATTR